jgi:ergothioneine biosynthesis protein EgtB
MNQAIEIAEGLGRRLSRVREASLANCAPLQLEDYALQAEAFTSPPKWHLAHTSWFFETFLLKPFLKDYETQDPRYEMLFNSYYNGVGEQFPRPQRGLLSRPSLDAVLAYREQVDSAMQSLLGQTAHPQRQTILERTRMGIEHECQHQELFFTDLKYSLAVNPLYPAYAEQAPRGKAWAAQPLNWLSFEGGLIEIGYDGDGFCFDHELPRHDSYLPPFQMASRLVTNGEFEAFIADGGYRRPELWLADGWDAVQRLGWSEPLYWRKQDAAAMEFSLHGLIPRDPHSPVCHISGYEAEAYARWAGARLPTEQEWEHAAESTGLRLDDRAGISLHPGSSDGRAALDQLYDACWQWTRSAYTPYPGFRASEGAVGEYNGKFMSSQWVLRGGSCVSSPEHLRSSYRNFFYPVDRWQFSGLRLARDL